MITHRGKDFNDWAFAWCWVIRRIRSSSAEGTGICFETTLLLCEQHNLTAVLIRTCTRYPSLWRFKAVTRRNALSIRGRGNPDVGYSLNFVPAREFPTMSPDSRNLLKHSNQKAWKSREEELRRSEVDPDVVGSCFDGSEVSRDLGMSRGSKSIACHKRESGCIDETASTISIDCALETKSDTFDSEDCLTVTCRSRADASVSPVEDNEGALRFVREDTVDDADKPNQSYISLIANAILACPEKRLVLSDIYSYVLEKHPYFRDKGPGWRNSIRHNLSLNECFVKAGRSPNGKGHFWAINPANFEDFSKGDFRRRRAQRRARRAVLHEPQLSSADPFYMHPAGRPMMPEVLFPFAIHPFHGYLPSRWQAVDSSSISVADLSSRLESLRSLSLDQSNGACKPVAVVRTQTPKRKRGFDVESLLREDKSDEERRPDKGTKVAWSSSKPLRVHACDTDYRNRQDVRKETLKPPCNTCSCTAPLNSCHCSLPRSARAGLFPTYPMLPPSPVGLSKNQWLPERKYKP